MIATVRGLYTILGKLHADSAQYPLQIRVPSENDCDVLISFESDLKSIVSNADFEISNETIEFLKNGDFIKVPSNIEEETATCQWPK